MFSRKPLKELEIAAHESRNDIFSGAELRGKFGGEQATRHNAGCSLAGPSLPS